jgi:WD40 repeat protein
MRVLTLVVRSNSHSERINDVSYPRGYSELFATCSGSDIRVWQAKTRNELLRIQVPNIECLCVDFTADGKSIISGKSISPLASSTSCIALLILL